MQIYFSIFHNVCVQTKNKKKRLKYTMFANKMDKLAKNSISRQSVVIPTLLRPGNLGTLTKDFTISQQLISRKQPGVQT